MLLKLPRRGNITQREIRALLGRVDPLIVEIGCNDGKDTREFLRHFPRARIHCFEPDPRPIARFLRRVPPSDSRVKLYPVAVGAVDGEAEFYASTGMPEGPHPLKNEIREWDLSGSLHAPTGHLTKSPWCKFRPPCRVPCTRLDTWLVQNPRIAKIDFMWVDVQGAQRDVIAGGRAALARTRYLYIEAYDQEMYQSEPTRAELCGLLPGFTPLSIHGDENILFRGPMR